jgi:hypothetical protein
VVEMENTLSDDFKKFFLIRFTEELIKHSAKKDITKLQKIIELNENKTELIKQPELEQPKEQIQMRKIGVTSEAAIKPKPIITPITRPAQRPALFIPEPKLPAHLEYLRPIPTAGIEIDLLKLNPLIKDPAVRVIEGNPDEKVKVTLPMGTRDTDIILSKEDIDRIIDKFSQISKIPKAEGIYRVVAGNLILSAIISDMVGSRFIIRKIIAPIANQPQYPKPNFSAINRPITNRPTIQPIINRNNLR